MQGPVSRQRFTSECTFLTQLTIAPSKRRKSIDAMVRVAFSLRRTNSGRFRHEGMQEPLRVEQWVENIRVPQSRSLRLWCAECTGQASCITRRWKVSCGMLAQERDDRVAPLYFLGQGLSMETIMARGWPSSLAPNSALADPDHGGPEGRIDPCGTGGLRTICDPCGPGGPIAAGAVSASAGWLPRQLVKP